MLELGALKMSLPSLIEIVPLEKPVRAEITVPGSKSITNRALILAALAEGEVTLKGALWSEDTQIMVECLHQLGFDVKVESDPAEFCNRTITVQGLGGKIPRAGTAEAPLELFVGNAGTAARFLAAFVCLGNGVYRLSGVPRMHERPQAALFQALRQLRYQVESEQGNDKLPVRIHGDGIAEAGFATRREVEASKITADFDGLQLGKVRPTKRPERWCKVSIGASSQFASALLLSAKLGGWEIEIVGENAEESPYVAMTSKLMEAFPNQGGTFQIEPDASSGSYFFATSRLELEGRYLNQVTVTAWPSSGWQIDGKFDDFAHFGGLRRLLEPGNPEMEKARQQIGSRLLKDIVKASKSEISRLSDLGDSIMTAIVVTALSDEPQKFTDLGRLRVQECERVVALRTELTKCGANVVEEGDTLTVFPSTLHGAEIETYNDHRMAMCFAILGLKVPGIKIKNPACVKKTFPNFFQKLAGAPPHGLGAVILDGETGRKLGHEDLFAD
jgi:3-phosphoshikimate 1-carboxyvinyltransferase